MLQLRKCHAKYPRLLFSDQKRKSITKAHLVLVSLLSLLSKALRVYAEKRETQCLQASLMDQS